jgi:hypothetical protein
MTEMSNAMINHIQKDKIMTRASMSFAKVVAAAVLAAVTSLSHAITTSPDIIDFHITSTNGGTLVWDLTTNRLIGTDIAAADITSQTLPGLEVVVAPVPCAGCVLNFVSGTNTAGLDFSGDLDGSSITVSTAQILDGGVTGTLLSGKFTGGGVLNLGSIFRLFGAGFTDTKDPALVEYLGFPAVEAWTGGLNLQFAATAGFSRGASVSVLSGDITNIPTTTPGEVPVPGAVWLFGSGLIGLLRFAQGRGNAGGFAAHRAGSVV